MAHKTAVHIEHRDDQWIVVREGNQRATSVHPTQSEAAESGRELARRDGTEFFLHGQDGQIREHRDYRADRTPEDEGVLDTALGTVGTVADAADGISSAATSALGADPRQETETTEAREREPATGSDRVVAETGEEGVLSGAESGVTPEERYADYEVYDEHGERIGPISDLFVDERDEPEYVGVEPGTITNRSVLIPAEVITIDDQLRQMVVSRPITVVETAPSLGYDEEVTPDFERRVRLHYALPIARGVEAGAIQGRTRGVGLTEPAETGSAEPASGVPDRQDDEVKVRRSEEELLVGRREREAGAMRIRKRVRTERERLQVPKKRTEISVERVPVDEGGTSGEEITATPQIGEEEIVVPVIEEEIVVEKRPVVKEEIRIRKQVVEDVEVVEEDVRKEEVEIEERTTRDTDL
jgi:uncharacterized protein (TIGR02271 family)